MHAPTCACVRMCACVHVHVYVCVRALCTCVVYVRASVYGSVHTCRVGPNRIWGFRLRIYTPYKPYIFRIFEISTSEFNFRGVIL